MEPAAAVGAGEPVGGDAGAAEDGGVLAELRPPGSETCDQERCLAAVRCRARTSRLA